MTKWICQDDATGEGPGGQSNGLCHPAVLAKLSATATTPGAKKSQAGWVLSDITRLLPALPLWTPRVTAGHERNSILQAAPGRAAKAGRKAPPLRPRQGHTWAPQAVGLGQRLAPASLAASLRTAGAASWAGSLAAGSQSPWGRGWVGPTQEGGVTEPRTSLGISLGFAVSAFVFFHPSPRGLNLLPCRLC